MATQGGGASGERTPADPLLPLVAANFLMQSPPTISVFYD